MQVAVEFRPNLSAILCPRAGMQLVRYWKSQGPERAGTVGNDGTGGPAPRFRNAYAGGCFSAGARSLQLHCRRSQSRYGHGGPAACGDAELVTGVQGIKVYRYKVSHLSHKKQRRGEGGASAFFVVLFVSKDLHWFYRGCAAGGEVAGYQRCC